MSIEQIEQLSVLLVEPSATQQRIITGYLQEIGVDHVHSVTSGEQGIQDILVKTPDIVISSMHFEDMTGADLIQKIRDEESIKDTPFILVSSETGYQYLEPVRQAGVVSILHKPFDQDQLKRSLIAALAYLTPVNLSHNKREILNTYKTLIVDDSTMSRNIIKRIVKNLGIEDITEAVNGVHAIELLFDNKFDLIITDYNMPEMDGKELIEHIRHEQTHADIPILMLSSESDQKRLAAVRQAGVSAIFDKPFEVDEIRQIINRII